MELEQKRTLWSRLRSFLIECRRVYKITKKPNKQEFSIIVKVSAIGMLIIGAMGFIIQMIALIIS